MSFFGWQEARLKPGREPSEVYDYLDGWSGAHHHFWDEPWWQGAYVVRVSGPQKRLDECAAVDHVVIWDATPDEELYGDDCPYVRDLFQASSDLAPLSEWDRRKLVHCFLNAQGMGRGDELAFHARCAWYAATIGIRWRLYLKRRWERNGGAPVKDES